eukprot:364660-Chlamydomonas_euryale.AAC.4
MAHTLPRPPRRQWPLHLQTAHETPKQDVRVQPGRVRRHAADVGACCTATASTGKAVGVGHKPNQLGTKMTM